MPRTPADASPAAASSAPARAAAPHLTGSPRIDLHTHSHFSDGTDSPTALVTKAAAAGVNVLALTDHDTFGGLAEARSAAQKVAEATDSDFMLIEGVEFSTRNEGRTQHLLGYCLQPTPRILDLLRRGAESRAQRVPAMIEALAGLGVHIDLDQVTRLSGGGTTGRPHVADAIIEAGYAASRDEVFAHLLAKGGPADIKRWVPSIEEAIEAITDGGGVAVIAHPWGRKGQVMFERLAQLREVGLLGVEVDHQEHGADARAYLRAAATRLDLIITGSSDHHGTGKVNHELGCNTTALDQFERLLAAAG